MKATFQADEKLAKEIPLTLTVTMRHCEWAQVRTDLETRMGEKYHVTTAHFLELVRGLLSAQHHALNASYEIDPWKVEKSS